MVSPVPEIELLANEARISALRMTSAARAAHIGSSLSMIDILAAIYCGIANLGTGENDPNRDVVLVSKGHAAAGVYAVMAHVGLIPIDWLERYCQDGAELGGHVTSEDIPWVDFSTGSLGHALPFGLGVALAAKRDGSPRRVFVLLSDGELDEGSNWEAALFASHHSLDNLTIFIDRNHLQSLRSTEDTISLEPLTDKWRAFGWNVENVDGHSIGDLISSYERLASKGSPAAIVCETIKGKGVSFMEGTIAWHYKSASADELLIAIEELGCER